MAVAVTGGVRAGSLSLGVSYDGSTVSSVAGANQGAAGGGSVTVSGADFGTNRLHDIDVDGVIMIRFFFFLCV